jgi:uncharacterized protein (TIGR02147 family)
MLSIYAYFDIRNFLQDDFAERKSRNPKFSLRAMADRLKVNSATIIRIMNGDRKISSNILPVFISYLGLRQKEAEYFRALVQFCQSKSEQNRQDAYRTLITIRNSMTRTVPSDHYAFYEEWYITVIREFLRINTFNGDYKHLASSLVPSITIHEAKRAINLLINLGFIEKKDDAYIVKENSITTGEKWDGAVIKTYQQQMLEKAIDAINRFPKEDRDISTMTMCYSEEGLKKVRDLLKSTREELSRIEESDKGANRVYQINMQTFPLTTAINRS